MIVVFPWKIIKNKFFRNVNIRFLMLLNMSCMIKVILPRQKDVLQGAFVDRRVPIGQIFLLIHWLLDWAFYIWSTYSIYENPDKYEALHSRIYSCTTRNISILFKTKSGLFPSKNICFVLGERPTEVLLLFYKHNTFYGTNGI